MKNISLETELERLDADENYAKILCTRIKEAHPREYTNTLRELINYAKKTNSSIALSWFYNSMGWVYFRKDEFKKANEYFEMAREIFENKQNTQGLAAIHNSLMCVNLRYLEFDKALENGLKSIEYAEKSNDYAQLTSTKGNLVDMYLTIGEPEKAKSISIQLENLSYSGSKELSIVGILNRVECEIETGDYNKALEYAQKAYDLSIEYKSNGIVDAIMKKGEIATDLGDFEEAESYFNDSIRLGNEISSLFSYGFIMYHLGRLAYSMGRYLEASEKLEMFINQVNDMEFSKEYIRAHHLLQSAYAKIGKYQKAYEYLAKVLEMEKKLESIRNSVKLKKFELKVLSDQADVYRVLYDQSQSIYDFGTIITSKLFMEDILGTVSDEIAKLIDMDILLIASQTENENEYSYQFAVEKGQRFKMDTEPISEDSFGGYCIKNKVEVFINDYDLEYSNFINDAESYEYINAKQDMVSPDFPYSMIFVPIIRNQKVTGVISVQSFQKNAYNLKDLSTLKILATYVGVAIENARLHKEAEYNASFDSLTKVLNRREILKLSDNVYENSSMNGKNLCVIMIDVDDFKMINDTFGHQTGDEVLSSIAYTINSSLRTQDVMGRYGGEEFIVVIKEETTEICQIIAERIRKNIENKMFISIDKQPLKVTVSLGIANLNTSYYSLKKIISSADKALYEAKKSGKNQSKVFSLTKGLN